MGPINSLRQRGLGTLLVISSLTIASCGSDQSGTAKQIVPNNQLQTLLLDLHLAEAEDPRPRNWRASQFEKHSVDSTHFHATLQYFASNPDSAQVVYDWVQDKLAERRELILADERERTRIVE